MLINRHWIVSVCSLAAFAASSAAHAQFAVIDVGAIAQLVQQVQALQEQLAIARDHLAQAQQEYQSITGQRGMQRLRSGTSVNAVEC